MRDVLAGVAPAAMDVPQVLGYSKIAGMPVITGLYTLLLPLVAFAAFGSSRYLVVAAASAKLWTVFLHFFINVPQNAASRISERILGGYGPLWNRRQRGFETEPIRAATERTVVGFRER
jgi:MFS superfamily sulfate permease-like transporter